MSRLGLGAERVGLRSCGRARQVRPRWGTQRAVSMSGSRGAGGMSALEGTRGEALRLHPPALVRRPCFAAAPWPFLGEILA